MADRDAKDLPDARRAGERRIGLLHPHVHVLAAILQAAITQHRARKKAGLEKNLEPVADAEHRAAAARQMPSPRA